MCFTKTNKQILDSLDRPLDLGNNDEPLWSDKCDYLDPSNCTDLNPENYNLVVMQLNIRSLLAHQTELKELLQTMSNKNSTVDVILLCETFLATNIEKLAYIPGYHLVTNNRNNHKGGGVAILIREGITYRKKNELCRMIDKELESVYVDITAKNGRQIRIGSIYRAPNTDVTKLMEHIELVSNKTGQSSNHELILGMDQNIDLLKSDEHTNTRKFLDLILDSGLWPVITRPTRITQRSATLIDNIYISKNLQRKFDSAILVDDISDHLPLVALLRQTKISDMSPIEFVSRRLNNTKISRIHQKLRNTDWNGILNSDDINDNTNQFMSELEAVMNSEAPLQTIRISGKRRYKEPWITKGIEAAAKKNRRLYKQTLKSSCTEQDVNKYKVNRNMLNRLRRSAMKEYYHSKYTEYRHNTKKLWGLINQTIKKCKNGGSIIPYISVNGLQTYNSSEIANTFGKYYASLGNDLASTITPGKYEIKHYINLIPRIDRSLVLRETSVMEIERLINSLPNKTSYGHDKVSNTLLKSLCTAISYPLQIIFNQSIYHGVFPDKMKLAEIVPLYKGKEHDLVVNYRPISLLMTISKILEKVIYHRLCTFLELNGTLFDSQYGFRSRRSCEHAILEMMGNLLQSRNKGLYSSGLYSCLGPLLFILFCNDIKLLPLYGKLILFADDTTLLNSHRNKNFVQYSIVHDIDILMDWFKANQLSLNLTKTVVLYFWDHKDTGRITVDGTDIPLVNNTKFLGVHINNQITWTTHTDQVHKKLMTNKVLLKSSCNMLTTDCLKSVYYAHIYSHLTYGLISWGPTIMKSAVNDLSWIQDACVRIVCKASKWASVNALYKQLQTLRFPELITLELAKYGYKISSKLYPTKIHELAETNGGSKRHRYYTRFKNTPNIQKHVSKEFNNSHMCKGLAVYNNLPDSLKGIKSLIKFSKEMKKYLLSQY